MPSDSPLAADAPTPGRHRAVLAGSVAAALLLAGGGYVLLSGGDDGAAGASAAPLTHGHPRAAASPTPSPTPSVPSTTTTAGGVARQPFKPVYVDATATGAAGTSSGPTSTGTPVGPTTPTTPTVAPTIVPVPVVPVPVAPAPKTTPTPYALRLVKIRSTGTSSLLTWTVDGRTVTTLNSQRFGRNGELVALSITRSSTGVLSVWVQAYAGAPFTVQVGQTRSVL